MPLKPVSNTAPLPVDTEEDVRGLMKKVLTSSYDMPGRIDTPGGLN
jgi:hypothetical protein